MDGLQAAWDHDQSSSSSSLLWGSFANNKLIMDHLAAEDQEHFFLNPIPHFIHSNIHHNKAQDSAGNTTASSLRMASPAGFGADVDPSYSISVDGSMESLDCLLTSASNSNTATTTTTTSAEDVDDESISLIFSSAGNFWNTPPPPPPPPLPTAATGETCRKPSHHNNSSRAAGKRKVETGGNKKTNHHHHLPLNPPKAKKPRHSYTSATSISENNNVSTNISFQQSDSCLTGGSSGGYDEPDQEAIAQMKEMIYRAAAFRPVNIGGEETAATQRPKRKNVRISTDPQTVAARQRRERISERIRILQKLVPGGNKMDTASMLDEAANYLKFLRSQVKALENAAGHTKISTSASTSPTTLQSFPLVVPTNLTFSSPSSIPTTTTNYGENSISGLLLPMQPQNNFSSLVLQNPSNLLYQYHHHHQPQV